MANEEAELMRWFKHQACEEQKYLAKISGLTDQVNSLNRNVNSCISQIHTKQLSLTAANQRLQELEQALVQSERSRALSDNSLEFEHAAHNSTKSYLAQEFAQHHRLEETLARQTQAMKNLSEFLTLMQGTSEQDKQVVIQALGGRNDMGALMIELEAKKQAYGELEEQRKEDLAQFEDTTRCIREHCLKNHQHTNTETHELDNRMDTEAPAGAQQPTPSYKRQKTRRPRIQRNPWAGESGALIEAEAHRATPTVGHQG